MRSKRRAQGIRTTARATALDRNDSTMQGTYWFDLRTRTPLGAQLKRVFDLSVAALLLVISSPVMLVLALRGVTLERRLGFRGTEFTAYGFRSRLLRRLPELFNVLEGTMSLVGPRAVTPDDAPQFNSRRFSMLPGMTSLWRVRGGSEADADRAYVNEWSLTLDVKILILTVLRW
ncbi:MAG TPA: sugar transferase [Thermoanaerobaculia bacterium]|nr:sugar transferase [Thermoanaerobaculia bacterium]